MVFRLINTSTLCIELFIGSQHPKYAILSHVWEPGHELTFQEMVAIIEDRDHRPKGKSGWTKILDTCRMAGDLGLKYAWVDTVCIDKTSSAELSEAINSMYRWYSEAEVCLVILADYDSTALDFADGLRRCRWFTRGWCLQELLAPRNLGFFDGDWNAIGTKKDLALVLSSITNINKAVLNDSKLIAKTPIAQRLSWASRRQTSIEEDKAYCLLGILDINMPMLYGEGPRAFMRLQEEIVKSTNDLSLFAHDDVELGVDAGPQASAFTVLNLFAVSPAAFRSCGSMLNSGHEEAWNDNYVVTNKGMLFRRARLDVLPAYGVYRMSLQCAASNGARQLMYLRKIGPSHYCRCRQTWQGSFTPTFTVVEEEVYVLINASTHSSEQLGRVSDYAIHVSSKHDINAALQILQGTHSTRLWDVSRMELLTLNESTVVAYWKIFPKLLRSPTYHDCDHYPNGPIYLVCGYIQHRDNASGGSKSLANIQRAAWLRLYRLEQWRKMEQLYGVITGEDNIFAFFADDDQDFPDQIKSRAEVVVDALKVTAEIKLEVQEQGPRYELVLNFEDTSTSAESAA